MWKLKKSKYYSIWMNPFMCWSYLLTNYTYMRVQNSKVWRGFVIMKLIIWGWFVWHVSLLFQIILPIVFQISNEFKSFNSVIIITFENLKKNGYSLRFWHCFNFSLQSDFFSYIGHKSRLAYQISGHLVLFSMCELISSRIISDFF